MSNIDPEQLKIPAYLRKKGITTRAKQKLILTALDRKNAGLSVKSTRALAPVKKARKAKVAIENTATATTKRSSARTPGEPSSEKKIYRFLGSSRENFQLQANEKIARNNLSPAREEIFEAPEIFSSSATEFAAPKNEVVKLIPIGKIVGYYAKIQVAIIHLEATLREGETIQLASQKFLFEQPVESMQIDRQDVEIAKKNDDIGLKVSFPVENHTTVYKKIKG